MLVRMAITITMLVQMGVRKTKSVRYFDNMMNCEMIIFVNNLSFFINGIKKNLYIIFF